MATVVWEPAWELILTAHVLPAIIARAEIAAGHMRENIPVSAEGSYGREPGYARDHITVHAGVDGLGAYVDAGTTALGADGTNYPMILERGSAPHTITSKGPWPLRDRHGNVFGRTVNHPGTKEYAWCRKAADRMNGEVIR